MYGNCLLLNRVYESEDEEGYGTLKDPFYKKLERGEVDLGKQDMYSKIKRDNARQARPQFGKDQQEEDSPPKRKKERRERKESAGESSRASTEGRSASRPSSLASSGGQKKKKKKKRPLESEDDTSSRETSEKRKVKVSRCGDQPRDIRVKVILAEIAESTWQYQVLFCDCKSFDNSCWTIFILLSCKISGELPQNSVAKSQRFMLVFQLFS